MQLHSVRLQIWSPFWSPGAIWSPIRSPEHLVVNLVVVNAFSFSTCPPSIFLPDTPLTMTSFCVQGGRGGQKRPKTCVHTNSILPKITGDFLVRLKSSKHISHPCYFLEKLRACVISRDDLPLLIKIEIRTNLNYR